MVNKYTNLTLLQDVAQKFKIRRGRKNSSLFMLELLEFYEGQTYNAQEPTTGTEGPITKPK